MLTSALQFIGACISETAVETKKIEGWDPVAKWLNNVELLCQCRYMLICVCSSLYLHLCYIDEVDCCKFIS